MTAGIVFCGFPLCGEIAFRGLYVEGNVPGTHSAQLAKCAITSMLWATSIMPRFLRRPEAWPLDRDRQLSVGSVPGAGPRG